MQEALLISTGVVALAEIGDKTQLLAMLLAARYRKPVPIILGILCATLLNHFAAAEAGKWVMHALGPRLMPWALAISFIGMAVWMLIPDKLDHNTRLMDRFGVFGATCVAFFLAEMGDKTQIATMALAARFDSLPLVVTGTTLGMMIANVPAVFVGQAAADKLPQRLVHGVAALIFALLAIATLWMPSP